MVNTFTLGGLLAYADDDAATGGGDDDDGSATTNATTSGPLVTTIKIYNDGPSDSSDVLSLVAFFVFIFLLLGLAACFFYGGDLAAWCRRSVVFPCRRLCCEGQRRKMWARHKDAVIRRDAAGAVHNSYEGPGVLLSGGTATSPMPAPAPVSSSAAADEMSVAAETPLTSSIDRVAADADDVDPLERQLDTLVGLEPLKDEIRALRRTLVVEQQRRRVLLGVSSANHNGAAESSTKRRRRRDAYADDLVGARAPHMVFRGNPGTGKTYCARLIARLLHELGYVDGGLVEVQRADLVAGYVGQTALKTRAVINRAKGGVLFVDEAYALAPRFSGGGARDFGSEAVQELMRDLTSGDPVVILAGYPAEMERFLRVNPGLSRRFQVRFDFPDYSVAQLAAIFVKIADRHGYALAPDVLADGALAGVLSENFAPSLCTKWNGGLPEGLFRRAQDALAKRLNVLSMSADAALTLSLDDVRAGAAILRSTLGAGEQQQARRQAPPQAPPPMMWGGGPVSSSSSSGPGGVRRRVRGPSSSSSNGPAMAAPPPGDLPVPTEGRPLLGGPADDDEDDDEDLYDDDAGGMAGGAAGDAHGVGSLEALLANPAGLGAALASLQTLAPRVAALEAAVSRRTTAPRTSAPAPAPGVDAPPDLAPTNPWDRV